jgi:1,4-alpha-glucan branching enzyme
MAGPVIHEHSLFTDDDLYLFNEGSHFRLYDKLGSHHLVRGGEEGTHFSVWAPNAEKVSLIGDFNGWDNSAHLLSQRAASAIPLPKRD